MERPRNGLDAEPSLTPLGPLATLTDRRKGISDIAPRGISGTIGETLPSLSPRTGAGFWLYDQLDTRVMEAGITAGKNRMVAAARLAILEVASTTGEPEDLRRYF